MPSLLLLSLLVLLLLWKFFTPVLADGFPLEFEWQQVSKILLIILANLNNAGVRVVSTHPLISKSSSPFTYLLEIVPRAPITISITVTFMFHNSFNFRARSRYSSLFLLSLILLCGLPDEQNSQFSRFSFFFCWLSQGLVIWLGLSDLFVSQNPRKLCTSDSPGQILGWAYTTCSYGQI